MRNVVCKIIEKGKISYRKEFKRKTKIKWRGDIP